LVLTDEQLQAALTALVRASQPLSIAVPYQTVNLLSNWMAAAKCTCWWQLDASAGELYRSELRKTLSPHSAVTARLTPRVCPDPKAWIFWFAHMMEFKSYADFCKTSLGSSEVFRNKSVGPLPPPIIAHEVRNNADRKGDLDSSIRVDRDPTPCDLSNVVAPEKAPCAFVDALGALAQLGLKEFGDPRSYSKPSPGLITMLTALGVHYRRFLMVMAKAGPSSGAGPPLELDWLWHGHIVHPESYSSDCRRLFGHVIPHVPGNPPSAKTDRKMTEVGQALVDEVEKSLRASLGGIAVSESLKMSPSKAGCDIEAAIVILGSLLPGGNRDYLKTFLGKLDVGEALRKASVEGFEPPSMSSTPIADDPTILNISVRLLSGTVVLQRSFFTHSRVSEVRAELAKVEKTDNLLKLFINGVELKDTVQLAAAGIKNDDVINLVREPKPKPKPKLAPRLKSPSCRRCSCFTSDCIAWKVDLTGAEVPEVFGCLKEGDMVRTGSKSPQERYRRVTRIWQSPVDGFTQTATLSSGCRLTLGHPVFLHGRWCKPESFAVPCDTFEDAVYTIELEGHVDTILIGDVICAALGVYCGSDFGWNIFTRKTVACDSRPCCKCKIAVVEGLDFATVDSSMLCQHYPPY